MAYQLACKGTATIMEHPNARINILCFNILFLSKIKEHKKMEKVHNLNVEQHTEYIVQKYQKKKNRQSCI